MAAGAITNARDLPQPIHSSDPPARQIAGAYAKWGPDLSRHVLGQYAAALVDRERRSVLLLQDSLGIQQAFYTVTDGVASFASRLSDLVAMIGPVALDHAYLADAIATASLASERTPYLGVSRLMAGQTWQWSPERPPAKGRPWAPPAAQPLTGHAREADWAEGLRDVVTGAIERHVPESGNTWCELSGGLDSTSVAALAGRLGRRVEAIAFVSRSGLSGGTDDTLSSHAAAVLGINRHTIDIDEYPPFHTVPDRFAAEPGTEIHRAQRDAYTRILHQHGVTTLLTGVGGDVAFGSEDCPPLHLADELLAGRLPGFLRELRTWMSGDPAARPATFWIRNWVLPVITRQVRRQRGFGVGALHSQLPAWIRRDYLQRHGTPRASRSGSVGLVDTTGLPLGRAILWEEALLQAAVIGETDSAERTTCTSHPLLDRPFLEFALMMPHGLRRTAGLDRVLQRRIMRGILPEPVRLRRDKGSNQAAFDSGLRSSRPWFSLLTYAPLLADLGIVDGIAWANEVRRASAGVVESAPHFFMAATMECWLQRLQLGVPAMDFQPNLEPPL